MNDYHLTQLNTVLDYIDQHLGDALSLTTLAAVGNYSPYHFHRLFRAYTNESLNDYITRKRVERIAGLLIRDPAQKITALAFEYGFSSNAALTKTFKKIYDMSPSAFRQLRSSRYDKIISSKNGQAAGIPEPYICHINQLKKWMSMQATVIVKELAPLKLLYVNQIGVEGLDNAFHRVIDRALETGLTYEQELELVRIYHDSFKVTAPDKVRMEIGVPVNREADAMPGFFYREFRPALCVTGHFEIMLQDLEQAWSSMFIWMNENGYKTRDERPFEIIRNNYKEHPQQKCILDLCIPVE